MSDKEIGAYSIVGIGSNYQLTKDLRLNAGISNLFDKQIYRKMTVHRPITNRAVRITQA